MRCVGPEDWDAGLPVAARRTVDELAAHRRWQLRPAEAAHEGARLRSKLLDGETRELLGPHQEATRIWNRRAQTAPLACLSFEAHGREPRARMTHHDGRAAREEADERELGEHLGVGYLRAAALCRGESRIFIHALCRAVGPRLRRRGVLLGLTVA